MLLLHTIDENIFAKKIYELTHIDTSIIDMLINLNLIQLIFKDPKSVVISNFGKKVTEYAIYKNATLKENYKNSLPYILAGYLNSRTIYTSFHIQDDKYIDLIQTNCQSKDHSILFTPAQQVDILELAIKIDYQKFCKHKINLLTEDEKNSLTKYIDNLIINTDCFDGIIKIKNSMNCIPQRFIIEIDYSEHKQFSNLECLYQSFDNFISKEINNYKKIVKQYKNDSNIQKIFERVCLKINIDKF